MLIPIMSNIYNNQCPGYNPYLAASTSPEATDPIYYQPDKPVSEPQQKKAKSTSKQKRQNITMTQEEQIILKERAAAAKMTVSGYVVKQCVYGQDSSGCDRAADLAQHLATMSNAINVLEDSEVKKIIEKEILAIWRILR